MSKYQKYQFEEKQTPEFLVNYGSCCFCQSSIKENEKYYFKGTGYSGEDNIAICEKCYLTEVS